MDVKTILGGLCTPEIEKALNEAIGKEFIPKEKFDDKLAVIKDLTGKLTERDTQLEELTPKAAGNEALMAEITKLQEQNKAVAADEQKKYREKLLDIKLNEQKPISLRALKAELELDKITFNENNDIIGLDEQIKAIKADEVRKNLFVQAPPVVQAGTGTPQAANTEVKTFTPPKIF